MDDISYENPGLSNYRFWYVTAVRSCDVIKDHQIVLLIISDRKELQQSAWSHCVQLIMMHRMAYMLTLRSREGHVT